jgi:hypothetical protein
VDQQCSKTKPIVLPRDHVERRCASVECTVDPLRVLGMLVPLYACFLNACVGHASAPSYTD